MNWREPNARLYAILDGSRFQNAEQVAEAAGELARAGVKILQYRNKLGDPRMMLEQATAIKRRVESRTLLIFNDRADLCLAAGFDGVHLGQEDIAPGSAREIVGAQRCLGVSTHNPEQVIGANETSADYIAVGPVFATYSKNNPDPVIGLDGVRRARELTKKPLIAIGGITRQNCRSVIDAGADSVAVISDLIRDTGKSAEEFLWILG